MKEEYSRLITNLYNTIKLLRDSYFAYKKEKWTTIDINCENDRFVVKYGFEDLKNSEYTPEQRTYYMEISKFKYRSRYFKS